MSCRRRNMPRRKRGQDSMDNLDQPGTSKTVSGTKRAKTLTTEPIDYARLAQEIVKIQQSTNSEVSSPSLAGENEPAKTLSKSMVQSNTQPKGSGLPETQSQLPEQSSSSQQGNESPSTIETVVSQLLSSSAGSLPVHASVKSTANTHSTGLFENLNPQACQLLAAALSNSTKASYKRTWDMFFLEYPTINSLPITATVLSNFIAQLFSKGYSPSSISSHVSAISYVHKILSVPDPAEAFLVRKILQGCYHSAPNKDSRLPITAPILLKLVKGLSSSVQNLYTRILLKSVFLLAFNAFLRLGEIVIKSKNEQSKVIQRDDVTFQFQHKTPCAVTIVLKNFKTNKTNDLFQINLEASGNEDMCPVQSLWLYLKTFSHESGPLFQFVGGEPVTYAFVTKNLQNTIRFIGLNPALYKGHSFRIGAATHAAHLGYSENCIQKMGRWKSDAVRRYIRLQSFTV
ncbi:uncharacterized protein LOC134254963 isoform X1 [Saccostrea cucullata]|uniref:uncharacterized protein LOC134254963 isoform X1 n=1 Tax=Saccostrea cuccullata TaxID=36930 RepID=UPI002ED54A9E